MCKKFRLFTLIACCTIMMGCVLIPSAHAELSKTEAQELAFHCCEDELGYPEDTIPSMLSLTNKIS